MRSGSLRHGPVASTSAFVLAYALPVDAGARALPFALPRGDLPVDLERLSIRDVLQSVLGEYHHS
jgi:hypothetical protein